MIKKNVFFSTVSYQYNIIIVVVGLVFPLISTGFLATEVTIAIMLVFFPRYPSSRGYRSNDKGLVIQYSAVQYKFY